VELHSRRRFVVEAAPLGLDCRCPVASGTRFPGEWAVVVSWAIPGFSVPADPAAFAQRISGDAAAEQAVD